MSTARNADEKLLNAIFGRENFCTNCGERSSTEYRFCITCGARNKNFDASLNPVVDDQDCKNGHAGLYDAMRITGTTSPFCSDCGFCGVPATWRKHISLISADTMNYELVIDNKKVANFSLKLTAAGDPDTGRLLLFRELGITFDQIFEHVERSPNLTDELRHQLLETKSKFQIAQDVARQVVYDFGN